MSEINLKNYDQYCKNWEDWADKQQVYPQPPTDQKLDQQAEDTQTTQPGLYRMAA
jgi:hypothetical protein